MSGFAGGSGTENDPYLIETVDHLEAMRPFTLEQRWRDDYVFEEHYKYFKLIGDLDMSRVNWQPFKYFSGCFDGGGHTISNIYVNTSSDDRNIGGLFNRTYMGVAIKDLTLTNIDVTNTGSSTRGTGGLVGRMSSQDNNCYFENIHIDGSLSAAGNGGGVFGNLESYENEVYADNCTANIYFMPNDDGVWYVAGFAGQIHVYEYSKIVLKDCHGKIEIGGTSSNYVSRFPSGFSGYTGVYGWREFAGAEYHATRCTGELISDALDDASFLSGFDSYLTTYDFAKVYLNECSAYIDTNFRWTMSGFVITELFGPLDEVHIKNCYVRGKIKGVIDNPQTSAHGFAYLGLWDNDDDPQKAIFKNCYSAIDDSELTILADTEYDYLYDMMYTYWGSIGVYIRQFEEHTPTVELENIYYDADLLHNDNWLNSQPDLFYGYDDVDWRDYNCYPRSTAEMTFPPNFNTTYINWDFQGIWTVDPQTNDGYPYFGAEEIPFAPVPGYMLRFIEPPTVRREYPKANRVIVKSPDAEYTASVSDISEDQMIERIVEIDAGGAGVCKEAAERLLERWSRINVSIEGDVRLAVGLSFKERVKVWIEDSQLTGQFYPLQSVEHDVVAQKTRVVCGDIILSDEELLARILDDLAGKW